MLKRINSLFFIGLLVVEVLFAEQSANSRVLIDGIVASVYGPSSTSIITYSDLIRPGIDGSKRTLEGLIMRSLEDQDAKRYGMQSTPEAIEKNLQAVFRSNNWLEDDFNKMVQNAGWMAQEAREEFRLMTDVAQIEGFKIYSQLIVPERDILAYYEDHPEFEEASFYIQRAVVPYDFNKQHEEQYDELVQLLKNKQLVLDWTAPFWVSDVDLSESKLFIKDLALNEISLPQDSPEGFEFLQQLKSSPRRKKSIEERRNSIIEVLREPKAEVLKNEYYKELLKPATVVYFDDEFKKAATE